MLAIQFGVARGIFSNESGMGSAAIAAAAAKTSHPVRQGLVSMTQTFIDTLIVVTITGLVIVTAGVWDTGRETAGVMTANAFSTGLPGEWGGTIVSLSIIFFAFSTLIGWSYYGERSLESLVGRIGTIPYRMLFTITALIGATVELDLVWSFSDLANGSHGTAEPRRPAHPLRPRGPRDEGVPQIRPEAPRDAGGGRRLPACPGQ